ncbi:MAG: hypothetical protein RLZZ179_2844 [Verrucomicrobiota bacterium]
MASSPRYVVCRLSLAAMRRGADVVSEMVNEVRGGEAAEVLRSRGKFRYVRLVQDGYEGWVDGRQFTDPSGELAPAATQVSDELCGTARCGDLEIALPLGNPLPGYDGSTFLLGGERWLWGGRVRELPAPGTVPDTAEVLAYARRFLRTPYLWGGRTVFGIDCSGFASSVLRAFSVAVSRDCVQQVREGRGVASLDEAVPGDLVYFAPPGESAQHVGMLLPCGEIIHASAMVRIDDLTPEGIVNRESGELTHRFLAIRRIMPVG